MFMAKRIVVPYEKIDRAILLIRNKRVMLDADLALVFGTTTKRLNERVRRNTDRFPSDFFFQLTKEEKDWAVANCDHLGQLKFSTVNPSRLLNMAPSCWQQYLTPRWRLKQV